MDPKKFVEDFKEQALTATPINIHQGTVIGVFEKACHGNINRKLVLKLLTGHTSSRDLSDGQWHALFDMVQPCKPEGGKWGSANPELESICGSLLALSLDQAGQIKMFESDTIPSEMENDHE